MERKYQYDVVVAGGGTAGTAAAIGAKKAGASVLLIERCPYLGGEATHSGVAAFCGFYTCGANPVKVVEGVGQMVLDEMSGLGPVLETIVSVTGNKNINFHPEYLKCALDNLADREGITCFLNTKLVGARQENGQIKEITCSDDEGIFKAEADVFVDATGDAALTHLSGGTTEWGDGNGSVQAATLPFRLSSVDTSSDMSPEAVEKAVRKAKEAGIPYLTKEKGFILKRENSSTVSVLLPSALPTGMSAAEMTAIEKETRRQVLHYVEALRRFMPGMEHCELAVIGPALGYRETRKMKGRERITASDVLARRKRKDTVARGGWKPEIHSSASGKAAYIDVENGSYFDIPIGALHSSDRDNLYGAGRIVCADREAFAAVRVMGTCFATGHAAGVAAACYAETGYENIENIQSVLREQGALI